MVRRLLPLVVLGLAGTALADGGPFPTPTPRAVDQTLTLPASSSATVFGASAGLTNPAGLGFVDGLAFDYLHQRSALNDRVGDGAYAAAGFGGLTLGFSLEWIRFGPGSGPGFRRTSSACASPACRGSGSPARRSR